MRKIEKNLADSVGAFVKSDSTRALLLSSYYNQAHTLSRVLREPKVFRKYFVGVLKHGRLSSVRVPAAISRVIFDQKLRNRQVGDPRGNIVAFFSHLGVDYVYKWKFPASQNESLRREVRALRALDGLEGFSPRVLSEERGGGFIMECIPLDDALTPLEREKIFVEVLAPAYLKKFGVAHEPVAKIMERCGIFPEEMHHFLAGQRVDTKKAQEMLSGSMTKGLVYGSRVGTNVFMSTAGPPVLVDFEDTQIGPIVADFERLWGRGHNQSIETLFAEISSGSSLNAQEQVLLWRGFLDSGVCSEIFDELPDSK